MVWLLISTGFTGAFTLMFLAKTVQHKFGTARQILAHFSPAGGCCEAIVQEIKKAKREILVQAYSFTSKDISQALVDAKKRRVKVDIILDGSNEREQYTELHFFLEHGLEPQIDAHHPIAHNKIMIIDGKTIITGSFNFTNQAEKENAENLLIIKGHSELVGIYKDRFHHHKEHSRAAQPKQHAPTVAPQTQPHHVLFHFHTKAA